MTASRTADTTTAPAIPSNDPTPSVSVVVATYNRPAELDRLLASLAVQDVPPGEVIVVDDGSAVPASPRFPEVDDIEWRLIRQENGGPGSARHTGIEAATGDVVVIVDDDMTVTPRFVASHLDAHRAGAEVVQGRFADADADHRPLFAEFIAAQQDALFERCAADPGAFAPERFATGNVSFRRELYRRVGGFDLTMRRREDSELGLRFAAAGARFHVGSELTSIHDEPAETVTQWLQLAFEYGESELLLAERHPETYRPWELLDDMPVVARWLVRATRRWPRAMRVLARSIAGAATLAGRFRLRPVASKLYGLAFVLSWFAGMSHAWSSNGRPDSDGPGRVAVDFGGVPVDVVDLDEAVERIVDFGRDGTVRIVVTPNVDHLVLFSRNASFARTYRRADLVLADGVPLVALSRLLRLPLRTKVSGSDLVLPLVGAASEAGSRIFLFGATDEVVADAAAELRRRHPDVRIVGSASPYFTPGSPDPVVAQADTYAAIEAIRAAEPDIVLVAFGAPKQEQLLDEFAGHLPPACYVCCGASLDFVAGHISRAPAWVSRCGMEWAYRLAKEPRRLWKRYIVRDAAALPIFASMTWRRVRGRDLVVDRSGP